MGPADETPRGLAGETLEVRDVRFGYARRREVLHGVNVTMPSGQLMAIVGPNGCGKTTLLKCLVRVNRMWSGSVVLSGPGGSTDLATCPLPEMARMVGYVPQRTGAELSGTVADYLLLGRRQFLSWRLTEDDLDEVARVLARLGIEGLANEAFAELSGGERQKVLVARALLQQPRVMLFDEPTNSLDIKNQREVMDLAASLAHDEGEVVVAVLHDLSAALRYADQVLLMDAGAVVACGTPGEVLTPQTVERVYGTRVAITPDGYVNPFA